MYHRFEHFNDAQEFINDPENEGAKLMTWHGPYMVFVPLTAPRRG